MYKVQPYILPVNPVSDSWLKVIRELDFSNYVFDNPGSLCFKNSGATTKVHEPWIGLPHYGLVKFRPTQKPARYKPIQSQTLFHEGKVVLVSGAKHNHIKLFA